MNRCRSCGSSFTTNTTALCMTLGKSSDTTHVHATCMHTQGRLSKFGGGG